MNQEAVYRVDNHGEVVDLLEAGGSPAGALEFQLRATETYRRVTRNFSYTSYHPRDVRQDTGWTEWLGHPDGPYFVDDHWIIRDRFRGSEKMRSTFYLQSWPSDIEGTWKTEKLEEIRKAAQSDDRETKDMLRDFVRLHGGLPTTDPVLIPTAVKWSGGVQKAHIWDAKDSRGLAIDHIQAVSTHWNTEGSWGRAGRNTTQADRKKFYRDEENLQLLDTPTNSWKGGPEYLSKTEEDFRGPADRP